MVGDGLMAVWNGSSPCPDHAEKAIGAAEEIWREGVPLDLLPNPDPLPSLIEEGWVVVENDHVRLTREGKALADPIAGMLV